MSIGTTLFTRLSTFAGLIALIGTRIYPVILPQGAIYPAVTYQVISGTRESCMGEDDGIVGGRVQFSAWADTYLSACAVIEQIRQALQRYATAGVQDIFLEGPYDLYDEDSLKYGQGLDAKVVYEEVV